MTLSDEKRDALRNEIFDLLAEAHVRLFQYNSHVMPGWARHAGLIKQAAGGIMPARIGEVIDSHRIARERNEAKAFAGIKEKKTKAPKTPKSVTKKADDKTEKQQLIDDARSIGLKVDARMSVATLKAKLAEQAGA